ncbi:MAG: hypothetical protein QXV97_04315 [Candidatus Caldarchaeum sp.]
MRLREMLDTSAEILTIISTVLYVLGYIDLGVFVSTVAAAAALMSTLLLHRMGKTIKRLARSDKTFIVHSLQGAVKTASQTCQVCHHPDRQEIDSMLSQGYGFENILEKYPALSRTSLIIHSSKHLTQSMKTPQGTVEELENLLAKLKNLYDQLEIIAGEQDVEKISARDFLAFVNARLDIIAKIKDVVLSLEKLKPSKETKDLSTLLQQLVEQNP